MTETIKLNFVNQSNDANNSEIVIFQQNVAEDFGELAIAWRVIENLGRLDNHPFDYPHSFQVSAEDSWGNFTPPLSAQYGQAYSMVKDASGDVLKLDSTPATSPTTVEIRNDLTQGAVNALIYKDGKLLAKKTNLAPGQKAVFSFQPKIYVGVASQVSAGDVMNSIIISQINTELALTGVASADIVMTGGGAGPGAQPFSFALKNIVMA